MNERLKELADQALKECDVLNALNRFAELIVGECISTVENISPGYEDYRNQIEDAFRRECVAEIKHKFGVQE